MDNNSIEVRARYGEVDRMGFVYYAAYTPWLVEAAQPLAPDDATCTHHPCAMKVSYKAPAFYDDLLTVTAEVESASDSVHVVVMRDGCQLITAQLRYSPSPPEVLDGYSRGSIQHTEIAVRSHEIQPWGIPAITAFTWFEASRNEHMRALGLTYAQCEEQGVWLPVVDAWVELIMGQPISRKVIVESTAVRKGLKVGFSNRLLDGNGMEIATGGTLHVCTTPAGKIKRPHEELMARLGA